MQFFKREILILFLKLNFNSKKKIGTMRINKFRNVISAEVKAHLFHFSKIKMNDCPSDCHNGIHQIDSN